MITIDQENVAKYPSLAQHAERLRKSSLATVPGGLTPMQTIDAFVKENGQGNLAEVLVDIFDRKNLPGSCANRLTCSHPAFEFGDIAEILIGIIPPDWSHEHQFYESDAEFDSVLFVSRKIHAQQLWYRI